MSDNAQVIHWGKECLLSKGYTLENPPVIILETPWSTVIRFVTSVDCFYLKKTPADLFLEPDIIEAIQKNIPTSFTPTILSKNHELHCFLMSSCGTHSLRTKFNGLIDADLLIKGLNSYINILRSFEENIDAVKAIGIPDWRVNHIPDLYVKLLQKKDMLIDEGLTHGEIDKLMRLESTIKSIAQFISEQKVKDTLVNADFNENNMIINEDAQQISIIDWGESVITHPFFSIASHVQASARRYKLGVDAPLLEKIKKKCLSCWLDIANMDELNRIYQSIMRLLPVFSSLGIHRLQVATQNKSKEMQNWFIAESLKTLLKNEK